MSVIMSLKCSFPIFNPFVYVQIVSAFVYLSIIRASSNDLHVWKFNRRVIIELVLQIGFLYLRYAGDPKTLWNWFEPYVKDEEVGMSV